MAMKLWRDLELPITLKYHELEGHFFPKLSRFKGLGDYSEDFVEQAHRIGVREESQTLAIRDHNFLNYIFSRNIKDLFPV